MTLQNATVLCYWNGNIIDGPEGISYGDGSSKLIKVPYTISYSELLDRIHTITGWNKSEFIVKIVGRFLTHSSPRHFVATPINDDESLTIMFGMLDYGGVHCVELYLESEMVCRSRRQPQTSCTNLLTLPVIANCDDEDIVIGSTSQVNCSDVSTQPASQIRGQERFFTRLSQPNRRESSPSTPCQELGVNSPSGMVQEEIPMPDYLCPIGGVNPGPKDPSVLKNQKSHRSSDIWENKAGVQHCLLRVRFGHAWTPHPRLHRYIMDAGFLGVLRIESTPIDNALMTALVERWRPETHTFHFPTGEMTVTLQDVAMLLGLPVDGEAIIGYLGGDWAGICETQLGVKPGENDISGSSIQIRWLHDNFSSLPEGASEDMVKCYTKAWLLHLIGVVLCPSKSGDSVSLSYLTFLQDLTKARSYSWGSAVLAKLYRGMCQASRRGAKELSCCVLLLQLWSWERLHVGRPTLLTTEGHNGRNELANKVVLDPTIVSNAYARPSYGYRWTQRKSYAENPRRSLHFYRVELDLLEENDVQWEPYERVVEADISLLCVEGQHIWRAIVPLICFDVVEWHFPDRVMHQFGLIQKIPQPCDTEFRLHKIDRRGKPQINWSLEHVSYVDKWNHRVNYVVDADSIESVDFLSSWATYLKWYLNITRLVIARPSDHDQANPNLQNHGKSGSWRRLVKSLSSISERSLQALNQINKNNGVAQQALAAIHSLSTSTLESVGRANHLFISLDHDNNAIQSAQGRGGLPSQPSQPQTQPDKERNNGQQREAQESTLGRGRPKKNLMSKRARRNH